MSPLVAVEPQAEGDVVVDAHGERVGLLEHHADVAADDDRVDRLGVDVLAEEVDVALEAEAGIRSFMRFRLRSTVLLPQPDGPMKPVILPLSIGT